MSKCQQTHIQKGLFKLCIELIQKLLNYNNIIILPIFNFLNRFRFLNFEEKLLLKVTCNRKKVLKFLLMMTRSLIFSFKPHFKV